MAKPGDITSIVDRLLEVQHQLQSGLLPQIEAAEKNVQTLTAQMTALNAKATAAASGGPPLMAKERQKLANLGTSLNNSQANLGALQQAAQNALNVPSYQSKARQLASQQARMAPQTAQQFGSLLNNSQIV